MENANLRPTGTKAAHKLANRLTPKNWRSNSVIRFMPGIGYVRITVVGNRYFDRGAGGFMGGGGWIFEGRVVCSAYPEAVDASDRIPVLKSKAGWEYRGEVLMTSGKTAIAGDRPSSKPATASLDQEFWSIEEALAYANGDDGGALAAASFPVKVTRTTTGYRLTTQQV